MIFLKHIQIPGLRTKEPRGLYLYLPEDYARSRARYPVLYMFDGHNVFYDSHATYGTCWGMKEYLEAAGTPVILAAVECNHEGNRRLWEYSPWSFHTPDFGLIRGRGRQTMDWIVSSLKPELDRTLRTLPDREHTWIAGSSMGGLMSLYAVTAYNSVFSRAAALSPSLWAGGWQLQRLIRRTDLGDPTRIYMDVGTAELPPEKHGSLAALFKTAALLTRSGADVAARLIPGGEHNEAAWEKRIPLFFDYLGPLGPELENEEAKP